MGGEDAQRDDLTGLGTYAACMEALGACVQQAQEGGGMVSVALVDLDMFKAVNDEHGPAVGDEVLRTVVAGLQEELGEIATLYRYGGDEFLAVMPGVEKEDAFLALEAARESLHGEHTLTVEEDEVRLSLSVSAGVASFPGDGTRPKELVRKAGDAVYRAKASGANKVCLAREERMVTKTSHYTRGQLDRLAALAEREGVGEAVLLREALDDLLRKYTL